MIGLHSNLENKEYFEIEIFEVYKAVLVGDAPFGRERYLYRFYSFYHEYRKGIISNSNILKILSFIYNDVEYSISNIYTSPNWNEAQTNSI